MQGAHRRSRRNGPTTGEHLLIDMAMAMRNLTRTLVRSSVPAVRAPAVGMRAFGTSAAARSETLFVHRDTPYNLSLIHI